MLEYCKPCKVQSNTHPDMKASVLHPVLITVPATSIHWYSCAVPRHFQSTTIIPCLFRLGLVLIAAKLLHSFR